MAIVLTQTNLKAPSGAVVGCSGATEARKAWAVLAKFAGPVGDRVFSPRVNANSTEAAVMFETIAGEPGNPDWAAGDWVVRLNVTSPEADLSLEEVHICRNSGGTFTSVGSATALAISLGTAGVKSVTVAGAVQVAAGTDVAYIVLVLKNANLTFNRNFGFTPDQDIDIPVEALFGFRLTEDGEPRVTDESTALNRIRRITENFVVLDNDGPRITENTALREARLTELTDIRVTENFV